MCSFLGTARNMPLPGKELLDDLCTRFVLNSPQEELESFERMLFLVEQAHWFYEDFVREAEPEADLQSMSLKSFAKLMFQYCPTLQQYSTVLDAIYRQFNDYKQVIPVMGAIMLNPTLDKCLLVKSWGSNGSWGFPRGKINPAEADIECAAREVLEETGMDLRGRLREEWSIHLHLAQKRTKLYIVPSIDESFPFHPRVRKEIAAFAWHDVASLPCTRQEDSQIYTAADGTRHRFFMVWNYVRQLRRWIRQNRKLSISVGPASGKGGRLKRAKAFKPSPTSASCKAATNGVLKAATSAGEAPHAAALPQPLLLDSSPVKGALESPQDAEERPSLRDMLTTAAAAAHACSMVGLQGWSRADSQDVLTTRSDPQRAASLPPQQQAGALDSGGPKEGFLSLDAVVASAAGGRAGICEAPVFSSSALTAFRLDKLAMLRFFVQ